MTPQPWHPIEDDILRTAKSLQAAYEELKRSGYKRTLASIKARNKRLKKDTQ